MHAENVNVNMNCNNGDTALLYAAMNSNVEMVQCLLDAPGIDPNVKNDTGYTPLLWAGKTGCVDIVRLLLQCANIDVNQKVQPFQSAVRCGVCYEKSDPIVMMPCCGIADSSLKFCRRCLIDYCKSERSGIAPCPSCRVPYTINAVNDSIELCIDTRCVLCDLPRPLQSECAMCIGCVRAQKRAFRYECNQCHQIQETAEQCDGLYLYQTQNGPYAYSSVTYPCQRCAANTHWRILSTDLLLISKEDLTGIWGADVKLQIENSRHLHHGDVRNDGEFTTLIWACQQGNQELVQMLLTCDAIDVNTTDGFGNTPLLVSAKNGHAGIVRCLLDSDKVDVSRQNKNGFSSLMVASQAGCEEVVDMLLDRDDILVNSQNSDGDTALILALKGSHITIVAWFLELKQVDVDARNNVGDSALHVACSRALDVTVVMMLDMFEDAGLIDVNSRNSDGRTPLMLASRYGHVWIMEALLAAERIQVNAQCNRGWTAMMYACWNGQVSALQMLLDPKYKADPKTRNNDGHTVRGIALHYQFVLIAHELEQLGVEL